MKKKIPAGMHVHTLLFSLGVDPEGWAKQHGFECNPATPHQRQRGLSGIATKRNGFYPLQPQGDRSR